MMPTDVRTLAVALFALALLALAVATLLTGEERTVARRRLRAGMHGCVLATVLLAAVDPQIGTLFRLLLIALGFEQITQQFPRPVGSDQKKFRAIRELQNGFFVEMNLSAKAIQSYCIQAIESIELTAEDWQVTAA